MALLIAERWNINYRIGNEIASIFLPLTEGTLWSYTNTEVLEKRGKRA
jgi:hypothetical protein